MLSRFSRFEEELLHDGEYREILAYGHSTLKFWLLLIFPGVFPKPFSDKMTPLFEALDDRTQKQVVVTAFRGIGKTSIIQQGFASRELCFNDTKFLVTMSSSATLAVMQSESLKNNLMMNEKIVSLFGQIKSEKRESFFSKDIWITTQGNIVLPRGAGQQIRGMNYLSQRPTLLLTDDAEDPKELKSEETQAEFRRWFFKDYMPCIDADSDSWRHIVLGTRSIANTILKDLQNDPGWLTVNIPLCDDNCKSYHPFRFSDEYCLGLRESLKRRGQLSVFYSEYLNQGAPPEDASFRQEMFKYYDPTKIDLNKRSIAETIVLVDPAKTVKQHSDWSAIVGVGIGVKENRFWVRDVIGRMLHPDELVNETFEMARRLNVRVIGVEVTSLDEFIQHKFLDAMHMRGEYYEFIWLKAQGKKEDRIKELVWYYRQGLIEHNETCCMPLEAQLLAFPEPDRWDIMDALAYLPKALEEGERYFSYYGSDNEQDVDAEFKELEEDEDDDLEPQGNWAIYK